MKRTASRKTPGAALLVLLLAAILLSSGCIQSLNLRSGVEAGPNHTITMQLKMPNDLPDARGTLAFRIPTGWTVTSVTYEGAATGVLNYSDSGNIVNYFNTTWDAKAIDPAHNGHKPGYTWWAGYTDTETVLKDDIVTLTIAIDTHNDSGSFLLDFVTGITDAASPFDPAANSAGATWEMGNVLGPPDYPSGVLLNQAITLLRATEPMVLNSNPANGSSDVPIGTAPTVTFSEAMDPALIDTAHVELFPQGSASHVEATVTYNDANHRATLQPSAPLLYGTTYDLKVDKTVQDLVGHAMAADYTASFTTVSPAVPHWTVRTPDSGATNQPLGTTVTVVFDQDMNAATISGANLFLTKVGAAATVAATVSYSAATRTAILDPTADLELGATYEVTITPAVQNLTGQGVSGAPVTWTFSTVPPPTPHWTVRTPDSGATNQPLGTTVTVVFDQDMNAATISGTSFFLTKAGAAAPVAATISYSAATRTAILDPTADIEPGSTYEVSLTAGVQNPTGQSVEGAPVTWTFNTVAAVPSFTDVTPGNPYYAAIQGMAAAGIIQGYPQPGGGSLFKPDDPVWRAQFAKMVVGALELPVAEGMTSPFTDLGPVIPGNLYPHAYVAVAYNNQITTGTSPTTFSPWDNISRAQVVTMVVRALQNLHPDALQPVPVGYVNTWGTDFSPIHGPNARIAEYNGLLAGLPLSGAANDPWAPMSRGEVAQVLWNMMELID